MSTCVNSSMASKRKASDSTNEPSLIAYIHCPRHCWYRSDTNLLKAITNALDVRACVINLSFDSREDAQMWCPQLNKLKRLETFECIFTGSVMSWYSTDELELLHNEEFDPENCS